jgi:hypothetical protein
MMAVLFRVHAIPFSAHWLKPFWEAVRAHTVARAVCHLAHQENALPV